MDKNEIVKFLRDSVDEKLSLQEQVEFLENFTPDKISAEDVATFVEFMSKEMAANLDLPGAIDICGTGGSGLPRINTSTISAFILAELGVGVAKHGNKAASGRFGSFDLLEKMGINIELGSERLEKIYGEENLAFIFAKKFHPVMRFFGEARVAIGKPTIFNVMGPLMNPAETKKQIIGTSFEKLMVLIAESCRLLGKERIMVVRGDNGLDEVTLSGKTTVVELKDGEILKYEIGPEDFGVETASFEEISGGDPEKNEQIALEILEAKCESRHKDLVLINSALALKLAGKTEDLKTAYQMAAEVGARAGEKFEKYKELSNE